jgi:chromosome partitioning protein
MRVALISSKGGAGKSALAISLAVEAQVRGHRVLLVDADAPQGTCLTWAQTATDAGYPAPAVVGMGAAMHRTDQLPTLAAPYDWVVIDTPGRLSDVQRSALMVADLALVPAGPSASDSWALAPTLALLEEARTMRPELVAALVLNRVQPRTAMSRSVRDGLRGVGVPLLRAELTQRVAHMDAIAVGRGVTTYAPTSPAAAELRALFDELTNTLIYRRNDAKVIRKRAPATRARAEAAPGHKQGPLRVGRTGAR